MVHTAQMTAGQTVPVQHPVRPPSDTSALPCRSSRTVYIALPNVSSARSYAQHSTPRSRVSLLVSS